MAAPISPFNSAAVLGAAAASAAAGSASPLADLQPGAVIAARVLALLENGQVRLASPVASTTASIASKPATLPAVLPDLPVTIAPQLVSAPAADTASALQAAVRKAVVTQNSLSPLFAEIAAAADLPALPEPVRREALRLLSLRPPLDAGLTAEDVKQAFANSGLFLEARIADDAPAPTVPKAGAKTDSAPGAATTATTPAAANALPAVDLKAALIVFRQILAVALAEDEGAPANSAAPLAVAEAVPAAVQMSVPVSAQAPALASLAARLVLPGPPESAATAPASRTPPIAPPPPFRDGPVTAQPSVLATIDETTPPHMAVQTLMAATDGALARQTLLQAASLPVPSPGPFSGHLDSGGPRWNFEVPFAVPQGAHVVTNVAQFEISRDGKAATPVDGSGPVWRARFSVDIDPIGRVHAQIGLRGVRAAVTLWAENPEGATRLRAGSARLNEALRAAALDAGDLVVRDGVPRTRMVAAGHFLERAS